MKAITNIQSALLLACFSATVWSCTKISKEQPAPYYQQVAGSADTVYQSAYPYNLNVVYFVPTDRSPDSAYKKRVSKYLLDGQQFYNNWMNYWGYGNKSFGLLKDTALQLIKITVVPAQKTAAEYVYGSGGTIQTEVKNYLAAHPAEKYSDQYLVIMCLQNHADADNKPFYGYVGGNWCFAIDYPGMDLDAAAHTTTYVGGMMHELGHGLGMPHDGGLRSINTQWGTSLMGSGNSTYGRSATYLTKADCAILNDCQVFNTQQRNDWYQAVSDTVKHLHAAYSNGSITVSGRFSTNSSGAINYVNFYNNPGTTGLGSNGDYKSSVWTAPVIGTDSFYVSMPYSDFNVQKDTTYQLGIMFVHMNGKTSTKKYNYLISNGAPVINIDN